MDVTEDRRDLSAELNALLLEDHDISQVLTSLAELAMEHLSADRHVLCGILLKRAKKNMVVATSSAEAQQMDELQAGFDEGPCLEAQRSGKLVRVPDVHHEKRWPSYMAEVRNHGLRSVLAVPMTLGTSSTAAMNFYAHDPGAFSEKDVATAQRYTDLASTVVAIALRIATHADDAEHRRLAMESRTTIDLAVGIIMGQNRCSQDEAVEILKQASSHRNIKLRVLAEQLVTSTGQLAPTTSFDP